MEYYAAFTDEGDSVDLIVWSDQPQPEGFEWDPGNGRRWWREIPRSTAQRLFEVETWALYLGRFPVLVDFIGAGDRVGIFFKRSSSPVFGAVPKDENGQTITPPGITGKPGDSWWDGSCNLADLSDARETVRELPLAFGNGTAGIETRGASSSGMGVSSEPTPTPSGTPRTP